VLCHHAIKATRHLPDCAHTKAGTIKVNRNKMAASFTPRGYRDVA
jgi:hypothetical protein